MGHVPFKPWGLTSPRNDIREQLLNEGFVRGSAADLVLLPDHYAAFRDLCADADAAPVDPAITPATFRRRLLGGFTWLPRSGHLELMPTFQDDQGREVREYTQPQSYNSEAMGKRRFFAAAEPRTHRNRLLIDLIYWMLDSSPLDEIDLLHPIQINFHIVAMEPTFDQPARVSPPYVHTDGETFTWAVLLRRDAAGGENFVTTRDQAGKPIAEVPAENILANFTLENALEWYCVNDAIVAHHVEPVTVRSGAQQGNRTVLLIDFTPMRPILVPPPSDH